MALNPPSVPLARHFSFGRCPKSEQLSLTRAQQINSAYNQHTL